MGDGTEFDFDSLWWWWFIDRNDHTDTDPDPNCNAFRHAVCNPHTRCNAYARCDAYAYADANADAYAYADSRSYANRSRMSDWGLQISDPCNGQFASYSRSILRCSSWVLELERAIGGCSSRAFQ